MKTDKELIENILAGRLDCFETVIGRYKRLLFSFLLSQHGNYQEVEDIVQETYIKAFRHLDKFDQKRKFSNWLLTIAKNLLIDLRRKAGRSVTSTEVVEETLLGLKNEGGGGQPQEEVLKKEKFQEVFDLIGKLPEEVRIPFILRVVDEQSYQDIAENLELPIQTVKNRIFKARQILREQKGSSL